MKQDDEQLQKDAAQKQIDELRSEIEQLKQNKVDKAPLTARQSTFEAYTEKVIEIFENDASFVNAIRAFKKASDDIKAKRKAAINKFYFPVIIILTLAYLAAGLIGAGIIGAVIGLIGGFIFGYNVSDSIESFIKGMAYKRAYKLDMQCVDFLKNNYPELYSVFREYQISIDNETKTYSIGKVGYYERCCIYHRYSFHKNKDHDCAVNCGIVEKLLISLGAFEKQGA